MASRSPLGKVYPEQRLFIGVFFGGVAGLLAYFGTDDVAFARNVGLAVGVVAAALGFVVFEVLVGGMALASSDSQASRDVLEKWDGIFPE